MTYRDTLAGFTLIEALIALAVLAITAVSLLNATEENIRQVARLESRAAAGWVAQNRLAELVLRIGPAAPPVPMIGLNFDVGVQTTPTSDPGLQQVDISVADPDGGVVGHLTGFVPAGGGP